MDTQYKFTITQTISGQTTEKYIELSCWLTESSVNDKFNQLVTGQLDSMF